MAFIGSLGAAALLTYALLNTSTPATIAVNTPEPAALTTQAAPSSTSSTTAQTMATTHTTNAERPQSGMSTPAGAASSTGANSIATTSPNATTDLPVSTTQAPTATASQTQHSNVALGQLGVPEISIGSDASQYIHLSEAELHQLGMEIDAEGSLTIYRRFSGTIMKDVFMGGQHAGSISYFSKPEAVLSEHSAKSETDVPKWLSMNECPDNRAITDDFGRVRSSRGNPSSTTATEEYIEFPVRPNDPHWNEKTMKHETESFAKIGIKVKFKFLTEEDVKLEKENTVTQRQQIRSQVSHHQLVGVAIDNPVTKAPCFIVWYDLNAELLQRLPQRYVHALGADESHSTGVLQLVQPEEQFISGCRLLATCQTAAGAIRESDVFPNPAVSDLSFSFELAEARQCSFALHYLNGQQASPLAQHVDYSSGKHTYSFALKDVQSGCYLVSMTTDKGERTVHRILVQR